MLTIQTVFGFGYAVSRVAAKALLQEKQSDLLVPMCHTCGQSSYFFGYRLKDINSRKGYVKFDNPPFFTEEAYNNICKTLEQEYEKIFGRKPVDKPTYIMYTDIVRS